MRKLAVISIISVYMYRVVVLQILGMYNSNNDDHRTCAFSVYYGNKPSIGCRVLCRVLLLLVLTLLL